MPGCPEHYLLSSLLARQFIFRLTARNCWRWWLRTSTRRCPPTAGKPSLLSLRCSWERVFWQCCRNTRSHEHRKERDRKSTRLNSSHLVISYAVFCLKKKNNRFTSHRAIGRGANPARPGSPGGGSGGAIYNAGHLFRVTPDEWCLRGTYARRRGEARL